MNKNFKLDLGKYEGTPVYFSRELANNGHIMILGATGEGKTTQIERIMVDMVKQKITVIAFDTNNVFANSQIHPVYAEDFKCHLNEIDVYSQGIPLPLFTPLTFSDGEHEKSVDIIDGITDAFAKTFRFGPKQKSTLRTAVETVATRDLYKEFGIKAIGAVLNDMKTSKAAEVKERISQITGHNVFVDGELFIQPGKINLIRISKFSDDTQSVIMEVISAFLWKYASKEMFEHDHYLIVDECQNMQWGKNSMIRKILVEGRRFHYNLLLSTQVLSQDAQITKLMTQAALMLHFKPAKSDYKATAKLIDANNEDAWHGVLASLNKGEFVAAGTIIYEDNLIRDPLVVSAFIPETTVQASVNKSNVIVKGISDKKDVPSDAIFNYG